MFSIEGITVACASWGLGISKLQFLIKKLKKKKFSSCKFLLIFVIKTEDPELYPDPNMDPDPHKSVRIHNPADKSVKMAGTADT
jgi:hypothetical protein